jgi:predicted flavoprotein YhiN
MIAQLRYSKETRIWARGIAHKGLLLTTLLGISGVSIVTLVKFLLDKSREAREKEIPAVPKRLPKVLQQAPTSLSIK